MTMTTDGASGSDERSQSDERLRYRVLIGLDDAAFCARVSAALDDGYELHGSPSLTHDGTETIVAQAVILPDRSAPGVPRPVRW